MKRIFAALMAISISLPVMANGASEYIGASFGGVYSTLYHESDGITMITTSNDRVYIYSAVVGAVTEWDIDSIDYQDGVVNIVSPNGKTMLTMKHVFDDVKVTFDDGRGFTLDHIRKFTRRDIAVLDSVITPVATNSSTKPKANAKPSFNCEKASSKIEVMICSNEDLSAKDNEMSVAFKQAVAASGDGGAGIKKGQKAWMKERNKCGDTQCLIKSYQEQIDELVSLRTYMSKPAEFR